MTWSHRDFPSWKAQEYSRVLREFLVGLLVCGMWYSWEGRKLNLRSFCDSVLSFYNLKQPKAKRISKPQCHASVAKKVTACFTPGNAEGLG